MTKNPKIVIVDYGVGNIYSIQKALKKFTVDVIVSEESEDIKTADAIILPGVGSFQAGIEGLRIRNLVEPLIEMIKGGKPTLGICLGAQLMLGRGYEFGDFVGLNIIPGQIVAFPPLNDKNRVPHIGWNNIIRPDNVLWEGTILDGLEEKSPDMYFVHSYIFMPEEESHVLSWTEYGGVRFPSSLRKGLVYGCQFHPEKSGANGLKLLENFILEIL